MALFTFSSYTLVAGGRLTVSTTFTALSLLSNLRGPMTQLPDEFFAYLSGKRPLSAATVQVMTFGSAYVSLQRIEAFLREEEVPDWASTLSAPRKPEDADSDKIAFVHASFEWNVRSDGENTAARFVLGPLDIDFPTGQLTLITGSTGSGKSALLGALLGGNYHPFLIFQCLTSRAELYCVNGSVSISKVGHQIAYCAQNPCKPLGFQIVDTALKV